MKLIKTFSLGLLFAKILFANNSYNYQLNNNIQYQVNSQLNQILNKYKYQSIVKNKNLIYYRPDQIKIVPPKVFYIWTRANITSIDNGKFYYIIPEGYRIVYQKEGEIYIQSPDGMGNSNIQILNNLY